MGCAGNLAGCAGSALGCAEYTRSGADCAGKVWERTSGVSECAGNALEWMCSDHVGFL